MVLVTEQLGAHIGPRDVVLRVVRDLPHIARVSGVEEQFAAEVTAHSARRRFDAPAGRRNLRVVGGAHGVHYAACDHGPDAADRQPCAHAVVLGSPAAFTEHLDFTDAHHKFALAVDIVEAAGFTPGRDRHDFWRR